MTTLSETLRLIPGVACHAAADELQRQAKEIEGLKAKADLYHWLQSGDNDELVIKHLSNGTAYLPRGEELDNAIRAAIEQQGDMK